MADETSRPSSAGKRLVIIAGVVLVALIVAGAWYLLTAGRESTDDAQVDAHVMPVAARVGGTVLKTPVADNQPVDAGTVLVALDPRDYEIAVAKARAELADAEASALEARSSVPITATAASSNVTNAQGSVEQARGAIEQTQKERVREVDAMGTKAARDVERLRGLLAKDEVSQQQFDAAVAAADAQRAGSDLARSQVVEAEAGVRVAESKLMQSRAGEQQAQAGLKSAQTAPEQIAAIRARASAAEARVMQAKATLDQAELNLEHTTLKAPVKGAVSRKSVEIGQVVQPGQPLMAIIPLDTVWVTANFKETQLSDVRPGQAAIVKVDAYGGREFRGKVESIAAATGARFSLLPPENATGNFVKVVQRVPVKIVLDGSQDPEHLLRPGMSVVATVNTK
jgi:membrane fusion protein (multidrug efflux system)